MIVKQIYNALKLFESVFQLLDSTTTFKLAEMTEGDFNNTDFGKVCGECQIIEMVSCGLTLSLLHILLISPMQN